MTDQIFNFPKYRNKANNSKCVFLPEVIPTTFSLHGTQWHICSRWGGAECGQAHQQYAGPDQGGDGEWGFRKGVPEGASEVVGRMGFGTNPADKHTRKTTWMYPVIKLPS